MGLEPAGAPPASSVGKASREALRLLTGAEQALERLAPLALGLLIGVFSVGAWYGSRSHDTDDRIVLALAAKEGFQVARGLESFVQRFPRFKVVLSRHQMLRWPMNWLVPPHANVKLFRLPMWQYALEVERPPDQPFVGRLCSDAGLPGSQE